MEKKACLVFVMLIIHSEGGKLKNANTATTSWPFDNSKIIFDDEVLDNILKPYTERNVKVTTATPRTVNRGTTPEAEANFRSIFDLEIICPIGYQKFYKCCLTGEEMYDEKIVENCID